MSEIILFQGDSITDCGRNREDVSSTGVGYVHMVKGELGCEYPGEYEFINKGISGNRIVDVYARIKKDIINLKPEYLSLLIGVNDVWHELGGKHNGVAADKFEKIYDMLITEILEALPNVKIMIMEPFVLEAEKYGLSFIALQDKFNEACKLAPASYWLRDGVHPTPMGHWIIKNEWIKAFRGYK